MEHAQRPSDAELLIRFTGGSKAAYERLVARYEKPIFNFIRRMIGSREEAEDLAQETFIAVYERAHTLRNADAFRTWIWAIAVNRCRDHLKLKHHRSHFSIETWRGELPAPGATDQLIERTEMGRLIEQAIRALSPDLRTAIVLKECEGLSYKEIADAVGCPMGTVKSRLFLARQELKTRLHALLNE